MKITETKRLYLREFNLKDAEAIYRLNKDPDVIKYTGDSPFRSVLEARMFLENYDAYATYGFGRWAVINKTNNDFLGWCGLKYAPDMDEYDIGFRFFKNQWNKGYATESAAACLTLGFQKFQIKVIVGRAMRENKGSIRVLENIGLTYMRPYDFEGKEGVVYAIKQ